MKKEAGKISALLGRTAFIGLSVQGLIGLLWIFGNMGSFQEYERSLFYLQASKDLVCDEYIGILYPLLIKLAGGLGRVVPLPYFVYLYVLQLGAGFYAVYFFLKMLTGGKRIGKGWLLWGSGVVNTMPMVACCHLAVLPASLGMSLLFLMLGFWWKVRADGPGARDLAGVGLLWLGISLLLPELMPIGALLVVLYGIWGIVGKKNYSAMVLLSVAFLGAVPVIFGMTHTAGVLGRAQKSPELTAMQRSAGNIFGYLYSQWPKELQEALTQEDILECEQSRESMLRILGEKVDRVYGQRKAREIYREVARAGWNRCYYQIPRDIALDIVGHAAAPVSNRMFLWGKGERNYAGRNYDVMRSNTPVVSRWCVDYSALWLIPGILLAGGWWLMQRIAPCSAEKALREKKEPRAGKEPVEGKEPRAGKEPAEGKEPRAGRLLCPGITLGCAVGIVLLYTMQGAGVMDYKESIWVTALWYIWMSDCVIRELGSVE